MKYVGSLTNNAPFTVHHDGGTTTTTVNQKQNQGQWVPLGTYALTPGSGHKVVVTDNTSGSVIADAVKYERNPTGTADIIVDNPSGTRTGTWLVKNWTFGGVFWGADYERTDEQGLGATFTWTPSLASTGIYRVYARWVSASNFAPDAPYTIHHAEGSTLVRMDQRYDGGRWNLLGEFTLEAGQNHRVVVTDDAQAWVFADAVRFVRVGSARIVQADAVKIVPNTAEDALYVHTDHLGTPRKMTDDSRAVVWDAEYRPFGEADSITGTAANDNRFPGQMFDAETGLHYNYWRDYDPTLGRYIQSDPIGLAGGLNTYAYVGGNPVNAVDPKGLESLLGGGGIGANPDCATPSERAVAAVITLLPLAIVAAPRILLGVIRSIARGKEFSIGKNIRVAPFGNRTGHPLGRWPHYHRRGPLDPKTGRTKDGQGIGRHRPLEKTRDDKSFLDRF